MRRADCRSQRVSGVIRRGYLFYSQDEPDHLLHLRLIRAGDSGNPLLYGIGSELANGQAPFAEHRRYNPSCLGDRNGAGYITPEIQSLNSGFCRLVSVQYASDRFKDDKKALGTGMACLCLYTAVIDIADFSIGKFNKTPARSSESRIYTDNPPLFGRLYSFNPLFSVKTFGDADIAIHVLHVVVFFQLVD